MQSSNSSKEQMMTENNEESNKKVSAELMELVKKCVAENKFNNFQINLVASGKDGDGYTGIITFLKITGTDKKNEKNILNIVAKSAHTSEYIRARIPIYSFYQREIVMYTKVFPAFFKFQKEYNLTSMFSSYTKCLGWSLEKEKETILLANLKTLGYKLWDRQKPMDKFHLEIVLKEYAKFHAVSFALKQKRLDLWKFLTADFKNVFENPVQSYQRMFGKLVVELLKLFTENVNSAEYKNLAYLNENLKDYLEKICEEVNENFVINHADCWCNNMMFKYNNVNAHEIPAEMCFLDFQMAGIGSVVLDISYFFYFCSSEEAIENFYYYMKEIYYKTLESQLEQFGMNPKTVYSYDTFLEEWKRYGLYGFLFTILVLKLAMSDDNEIPKVAEMNTNDTMIKFNKIKNQQNYDNKMICLVKHLVKNNLF